MVRLVRHSQRKRGVNTIGSTYRHGVRLDGTGETNTPTLDERGGILEAALVRIGEVIYWLSSPCPDCGQGGSLVFVTCGGCGRLALCCGEVTLPAFPDDPHDLSWEVNPATSCPTCDQYRIEEFRTATWEEIRSSGFEWDESCLAFSDIQHRRPRI